MKNKCVGVPRTWLNLVEYLLGTHEVLGLTSPPALHKPGMVAYICISQHLGGGGHRKKDQELKDILDYTVTAYKILSEKEK